MSPRILTPVILAADALLAVVLGVALPLLCTTAIWISDGITGDWGVALATAVGAWALSIGGDLAVTLDAGMLQPLGLDDAVAFEVGIAPLGLTLATIIPAMRSGARLRDDEAPLLVALLGPVAFGLAAWGLGAVASSPGIAIDALGAALLGGLIYFASLSVGAKIWERIPEDWLETWTVGWGRAGLAALARGTGIMLAGIVALGSLLLVTSMLLGMGRMLTIFQALHLDIVGAITLGLGQLALLPNAIAWSISWMLGPGFAVGDGSSIAPLATNVGPLPAVPLLGALPEGIPPVVIVVVVLPVAVGVIAGLAMRLSPGADEWHRGWRRFATPLIASAAAAIAISLFGIFASGAVGPGRLAVTGPNPGWMLLAAFATLALGALTGAFVPMSEFEEDTAESSAQRDERGGRTTERSRETASSVAARGARSTSGATAPSGSSSGSSARASKTGAGRDGGDGTTASGSAHSDAPKRAPKQAPKQAAKQRPNKAPKQAPKQEHEHTPRQAPRADEASETETPNVAPRPRTPRDNDEPDIYAGIDPLADD